MSTSTAFDTTRLLNNVARETYIAERDDSASNPGPQNFDLAKLNPNSDVPPPRIMASSSRFGIPSTSPIAAFRKVAGPTRSQRASCRSRRISPASICGSPKAASGSCIGISPMNGR
jgi:hypothetical protein